MTFEEMQKTIEGMLAVQRELQEGQFKFQENQINFQTSLQALREEQATFQANFQAGLQTLREEQAELSRREGVLIEEMHRLIEISNRHENRINQLIGYSITDESDRYTLMERLMRVERRLDQLENRDSQS